MTLNIANKITICRILSVPFFISAVLYYSPEKDYLRYVALGIFMFAVISDVVDGYIARMRNLQTKAGAILDPLADKLLLISAFSCIYKIGVDFSVVRFPIWLVVSVISRDVVLLLGSMVIFLINKDLVVEPTIYGKASAFFQITSVITMLLQFRHSEIIWYITFVFIFISAVDYIIKGIKILNYGGAK